MITLFQHFLNLFKKKPVNTVETPKPPEIAEVQKAPVIEEVKPTPPVNLPDTVTVSAESKETNTITHTEEKVVVESKEDDKVIEVHILNLDAPKKKSRSRKPSSGTKRKSKKQSEVKE